MVYLEDRIKAICTKLRLWFFHETWALPVDIFRILVGILCVFYYFFLFLEVRDFSSPDGLVSHEFYLEHFWWLNINLIQPGTPTLVFYVLIALAWIGSWAIITGYRTKLVAGILFLITVCIQRWNFAVMFVDDGIMHLALFWLVLLPVGKTLVLNEWLKEGKGCLSKWVRIKVPGVAVSCLIFNICWAYLIAGLTKLTSPMWQEGVALYSILILPISRMPYFWQPEHLGILKVANYAAVITEIALPFLLLSPKGSLRKWLGLILQIPFHLGIILTLKIPFANFAFIASGVLFFREEIMEAIRKGFEGPKPELEPKANKKAYIYSAIAIVFVTLVCLSTLRRIPPFKPIGLFATKVLWLVGISQDYRLFDWIDRTNYHMVQRAIFYPLGSTQPKEIKPTKIIPRSVRYALILARVYDVYWLLHIPPALKPQIEKETRRRIGKRACRVLGSSGRLILETTIHHITPDNVERKKRPRIDVMSFWCLNGKLVDNLP